MAKRIYVADDELHIRTLIQTFLVNEGYEVETFEDGKSLFEAFHTSCPDLIILDIMILEWTALPCVRRSAGRAGFPLSSCQPRTLPWTGSRASPCSDDYMVKPFFLWSW